MEDLELRRDRDKNGAMVSGPSSSEKPEPHLTDDARTHFEEFFAVARVLPISSSVITWAVRLRQQRRMTLGDAQVAGTALQHDLTLVTKNTDAFIGS
jgi:toxin FitB